MQVATLGTGGRGEAAWLAESQVLLDSLGGWWTARKVVATGAGLLGEPLWVASPVPVRVVESWDWLESLGWGSLGMVGLVESLRVS